MDFILDIFLTILIGVTKIPKAIGSSVYYIRHFPHYIALRYRLQKLWFPYQYDVQTHHAEDKHAEYHMPDFDNKIEWLDENIGKYRWKIINRKGLYHRKHIKRKISLCFRHKRDAMAFKLKWIEQ